MDATVKENLNIKKAKTDYPIHPLIANRWSPRVFSDQELSDQDLNRLFEAARWAASSNNYQPWRFIVTKKGTAAYQKAFDCLAEFNQGWVDSPILVLAGFKKEFDKGKENFHALHDLGLALGNLSIQAEHMGIALHHMAGLNWKKVHEIFSVPEGYHIATAIAIGYTGGNINDLPEDLQQQERAPRKRKPQKDFVFYGAWEK